MLRTQGTTHCWHTLSRSYGVNLPSSLTLFHSNALEFSSCPPELVCSTDSQASTFSGFSCEHGITDLVSIKKRRHHVSELPSRICQRRLPTRLNQNPMTGPATLLHPRITLLAKYRNINLLSIDYAFRPRLRIRLTLRGRAFPRKP